MSDQSKTKEEFAIDYIKSLVAVEEEMLPYQEHKKDLRKSYIENGWLNRQEIWAAVKAYRFIQKDGDMDQFTEMYDKLRKSGFQPIKTIYSFKAPFGGLFLFELLIWVSDTIYTQETES